MSTTIYRKFLYVVNAFLAVIGLFFAVATVKATTDPQNPSALTATLTGSTTIRLSWTPVGTADYFWVYRSSGGDPGYADILDIISGTRTTYTNSALQPGTTYTYRVRAVKNWAEAPLLSAPLAKQTTEGTNPSTSNGSTPGSLPTATTFGTAKITTSSIVLTWPFIANVDNIKLYRSTQGPTTFLLPLTTLTGNATTYADNGLNPSTTYFYRLTTVKNGTETPVATSPVTSGSTQPFVYSAPPTISSLIATPQAGSSIMLSWSYSATPVDNFHIFRNSYGSYGAFESVTLVPGTARLYSDSNLSPGTTYYYRITTIANGVESSLSNALQAVATAVIDPTTPNYSSNYWYYPYYTNPTYPISYYPTSINTTYPSYVGNLTATALPNAQVRLTWSSTGPAEQFVVYQSADNFLFSPLATVSSSATSYTTSYVLPNSTYWFKVASVRGGRESATGNAVRITTQTSGTPIATTINNPIANNERLLQPSRSTSPIRFVVGDHSGIITYQKPLTLRYQFKNTFNTLSTFIFKEEIINQYGSVIDTTLSTERIRKQATLTVPVRITAPELTSGLYTLKVSVFQKTSSQQRYIGENDVRFRVE